ncbi:Rieske (2Fe-2S) protein [Marinigracilibium pacificum]|uniref:Rieske 2Fe-2S domain-containing protein n=1 Tax=Marinigracilibium pacificum TaxID=2729599 RepID=A0A848IXU7_9BACT|nr:Rieske 2Fe-2S domain-containing protein [Marinigracilibium pacificum]NMM47100.1 Rieske 2Fe-2S domain-containing protein [Marinigracilibium pacificum]
MKKYTLFDSSEIFDEKFPVGSRKLIKAGDKVVLLIRHIETDLLATEPNCPHNNKNLIEAPIINNEYLVCLMHGYRFKMFSGEEEKRRCRNLKIYETQITDNGIFLYC